MKLAGDSGFSVHGWPVFTDAHRPVPLGSLVTALGTIFPWWRLLPADSDVSETRHVSVSRARISRLQQKQACTDVLLPCQCTATGFGPPITWKILQGCGAPQVDQGAHLPTSSPWDLPQPEQVPCHVPWAPPSFQQSVTPGAGAVGVTGHGREKVGLWGRFREEECS